MQKNSHYLNDKLNLVPQPIERTKVGLIQVLVTSYVN